MLDSTAAAPVAPTPTTEAQPTPAPAAPPERAELEKLRGIHEKRVKEAIIERRKFEAQLKELSPKAQKLAELEKLDALAKLNPPEFLKSKYGDKWYDIIVESKLNGAPPADVVAAEISRVEDRFNAELAKRDAAAKAQQEAASKAQQSSQLRQIRDDMAGFFHASKAEYPALEARHGNPTAVGNALFAHIKAAWDAHAKYDESGRLVSDTKAMTPKQAADELEEAERSFAQKVAAHEKYAPKFREALTPKQMSNTMGGPKLQQDSQQQSQSGSQQQARRTLSNDITGSTPGRQPPATLEERRRRAIERYNEVRRR
jgi:hypothetical protein